MTYQRLPGHDNGESAQGSQNSPPTDVSFSALSSSPSASSSSSSSSSSRTRRASITASPITDNPNPRDDTPEPVLGSAPPGERSTVSLLDKYRLFSMPYGQIAFHMVPDPCATGSRTARWEAFFAAKCLDVPHLMREGFFWSADNLVPEEGRMGYLPDPEWTDKGFHKMRTWILTDKSENPQWAARLQVFAPDLKTLSAFRLQMLTKQNISTANAWDVRDDVVYNYDHYRPGQNFNCIYDDRPLKGWWPWPREDGEGGACRCAMNRVNRRRKPRPKAAAASRHSPRGASDGTPEDSGCVIL